MSRLPSCNNILKSSLPVFVLGEIDCLLNMSHVVVLVLLLPSILLFLLLLYLS